MQTKADVSPGCANLYIQFTEAEQREDVVVVAVVVVFVVVVVVGCFIALLFCSSVPLCCKLLGTVKLHGHLFQGWFSPPSEKSLLRSQNFPQVQEPSAWLKVQLQLWV